MQKVKMETRWFVECPHTECGAEHDVDTYESGEIECVCCGTKFEYDNGNPEQAEAV